MESTVAAGTTKRVRDDPDEWLDTKRLRAAGLLLLDILEDGDSAFPNPAAGDIATVMKSLEEEIAETTAAQASPPPSTNNSEKALRSDLGYLLEASDDELGLPPAVPPFSDEGSGAEGGVEEDVKQATEGFGQIWGFADEIPACYDALGCGGPAGQGEASGSGGTLVDGALFGFDDVATSWPSDLLDFFLRAKSLPAV